MRMWSVKYKYHVLNPNRRNASYNRTGIHPLCAVCFSGTSIYVTYARLYLSDQATVFRAHPKEQTTVILGSGLVASERYLILPIAHIINTRSTTDHSALCIG